MPPPEHHSHAGNDRAAAIAQIIKGVLEQRAQGKPIAEDDIVRANPGLAPELALELAKLRRIHEARDAAEQETLSMAPTAEKIAEKLLSDGDNLLPVVPGYAILRELSRGGQGVVYLAEQLSTKRQVAMKILRKGRFADERARARFEREVEVLASMNDPHIVTILDTGETADSGRFITMNYVAGRALDDWMVDWRKRKPSDPSCVLRLFMTICLAVNEAHLKGIVHRDLKPSNIRVDDKEQPHILDFGLAYTALDRFSREPNMPVNVSGEFLGSLPWASPEQAEGELDKIDMRTDVYSLGVILYQLVTGGMFPYQVVGNICDVLQNILTKEPTPPSQVLKGVHADGAAPSAMPVPQVTMVNEAIEKIVMKALAKRRQDRYQSAGEMARDIGNYLSGMPIWIEVKVEKPAEPTPNGLPRGVAALLAVTPYLVSMWVGTSWYFRWPPLFHAVASQVRTQAVEPVSTRNGAGAAESTNATMPADSHDHP